MPRYFTVSAAEAIVAEVAPKVKRSVHVKTELDEVSARFDAWTLRVNLSGGMIVDQRQILNLRHRREALAPRLRELIDEIQEHGCQIKDIDRGLLDFPTLYRGREVLLCWMLGEPSIGFWHGLEDGFAGRREIDEEFLANHSDG